MNDMMYGLQVFTDSTMTMTRKRFVPEKSWTRPYAIERIVQVPSNDAVQLGNRIYMHPETWAQVRKQMEKRK